MICCTFIADIFSRKKYYEMSNVRGHGNINIESRMSQLIVKKYHRKLRHEVAAHAPLHSLRLRRERSGILRR